MENKTKSSRIRDALVSGLPQIVVLIVGIIAFFGFYKAHLIFAWIRKVILILTPVIIGLALAYLLNPSMTFFEKKIAAYLDKNMKKKDRIPMISRILGLAASFVILFLAIYLVFYMVIPQIYNNVRNLIDVLTHIDINKIIKDINNLIKGDDQINTIVNNFYKESVSFLTNWVKKDMVDQFSVVLNGVMGFFSKLLDVLVGVIVAIYVLMSKETFKRQGKKILEAFLSDRQTEIVLDVIKETDRIFGGFIIGKIIDSFIIGVLCFFGMLILHLPYAALISVIVGVTNVIPFFGPYIGAVPSTILLLFTSPSAALIFVVFILVLQQFDGNILGPKILGESTGLSPFWVIFSILLGGGLFGVVGMLFGVPVFAVIYYLFKRYINFRINRKNKMETAQLPPDDLPVPEEAAKEGNA